MSGFKFTEVWQIFLIFLLPHIGKKKRWLFFADA